MSTNPVKNPKELSNDPKMASSPSISAPSTNIWNSLPPDVRTKMQASKRRWQPSDRFREFVGKSTISDEFGGILIGEQGLSWRGRGFSDASSIPITNEQIKIAGKTWDDVPAGEFPVSGKALSDLVRDLGGVPRHGGMLRLTPAIYRGDDRLEENVPVIGRYRRSEGSPVIDFIISPVIDFIISPKIPNDYVPPTPVAPSRVSSPPKFSPHDRRVESERALTKRLKAFDRSLKKMTPEQQDEARREHKEFLHDLLELQHRRAEENRIKALRDAPGAFEANVEASKPMWAKLHPKTDLQQKREIVQKLRQAQNDLKYEEHEAKHREPGYGSKGEEGTGPERSANWARVYALQGYVNDLKLGRDVQKPDLEKIRVRAHDNWWREHNAAEKHAGERHEGRKSSHRGRKHLKSLRAETLSMLDAAGDPFPFKDEEFAKQRERVLEENVKSLKVERKSEEKLKRKREKSKKPKQLKKEVKHMSEKQAEQKAEQKRDEGLLARVIPVTETKTEVFVAPAIPKTPADKKTVQRKAEKRRARGKRARVVKGPSAGKGNKWHLFADGNRTVAAPGKESRGDGNR